MNLDDLRRDFEEHIEMETRDNVERGMTPEAARAAALRKFGNVARATEETYRVWRWMWLDRLRQDLRYAWRGLRKSPGFAAVAIATLALGIGMNTAVFSVVNAALLRPLPYPNADRLVWVANVHERLHMEAVAGPDFFDWKERAHSFERMASYAFDSQPMGVGDESEQTGLASVGDGFFEITGARPALGRLFDAGDRNVVALSHGLFLRRFGGDPKAIGKAVTINGRSFTICGVLPETYRFVLPLEFPGLDIRSIEAYVPSEFTAANQDRRRGMAILNVLAKLKPDVRVSQALAELEGIQANIAREHPDGFSGLAKLRVTPMQEKLVGGERRALMVLLAAVGFVLLIACVNTANLLLSRASSRQREMAIRAAVGAGRARVTAQLLVEGGVLALAGGAAGVLLARLALGAVVRLGAGAVPRLGETTIDGRVLVFTLGLSLATGVLFGLGPAIALSRARLSDVLKDGGRAASAGAAGLRLRRLLMAMEVGASVVLLIGAGLMVRSFRILHERAPGFTPERVLTMKVSLAGANYRERPEQVVYFARVLERLRGAPGVRAAGITNSLLGGFVEVEGVRFPPLQGPRTTYHTISSGYFRALGMRLVAGRWVTDDERTPAVMVNESFVRAVFGGGDPIGRRMAIPGPDPQHNAQATIVGVVSDLKYAKLDAEPAPETYVPFRHAAFLRRMDVLVQVEGKPAAAGVFRRLVADVDRGQAVYDVETLEQALADSIAPRRFNLLLLGIFAAAALGLAVVGVYGVMAYGVAQRSHEIGVRMALGAQRGEVIGMVVRQGLATAAAGVGAGAAAALGLTRLMAMLLYGVRPTDPATFGAVCGVLLVAALGACGAPAWRAARVDPGTALRWE